MCFFHLIVFCSFSCLEENVELNLCVLYQMVIVVRLMTLSVAHSQYHRMARSSVTNEYERKEGSGRGLSWHLAGGIHHKISIISLSLFDKQESDLSSCTSFMKIVKCILRLNVHLPFQWMCSPAIHTSSQVQNLDWRPAYMSSFRCLSQSLQTNARMQLQIRTRLFLQNIFQWIIY
jgi:hypothetical protein